MPLLATLFLGGVLFAGPRCGDPPIAGQRLLLVLIVFLVATGHHAAQTLGFMWEKPADQQEGDDEQHQCNCQADEDPSHN